MLPLPGCAGKTTGLETGNRPPALGLERVAKLPEIHAQRGESKVEKKTVLVVDDDRAVIEMLELVLKDEFRVLKAENADRALYVLESFIPQLIITDLNMPPGRNGIELSRIVRSNPDGKISKVPIIMLTAEEKNIHEPVAKAVGVNRFLEKPPSFKELRLVISELLG